ncbi:MAG: hypothetical protein ABI306_01150 [Caulobacteraceae bacterium]
MTTRNLTRAAGACLAAISAAAMLADASLAAAQPAQGYGNSGQYDNSGPPPPGQYDNSGGYNNADQSGPPQGQYAPPPPGYGNGNAQYDDRSQQTDRDYAQRYQQWSAQNCIDRRNNNTAAGAIIGGVLGAVVGAGVAGRGNAGAGALLGGALGAGTGAAIGSSSSSTAGCPPGYYVRAGAPAFVYGGGYGPGVVYAPAWYRPWVWSGGRWNYTPYRSWYWNHRTYWRPGWRGRPYRPYRPY